MTLWEIELACDIGDERVDGPLSVKVSVVGDFDAESALSAARDLVRSRGFAYPSAAEDVSADEIEGIAVRGIRQVCPVHAITNDVLKRGEKAFIAPRYAR